MSYELTREEAEGSFFITGFLLFADEINASDLEVDEVRTLINEWSRGFRDENSPELARSLYRMASRAFRRVCQEFDDYAEEGTPSTGEFAFRHAIVDEQYE